MKRSDLRKLLERAASVLGDEEVVVIGSQAILGSFQDDILPETCLMSVEADFLPLGDEDERKADAIDWLMGDGSAFHTHNGVYAQGVGLATAHLPAGWEDRLVPFTGGSDRSMVALCLDPADLVASKLLAGRPKDRIFAKALFEGNFVDPLVVLVRLSGMPQSRYLSWAINVTSHYAEQRQPGARYFNPPAVSRSLARRAHRAAQRLTKNR